MTSFEPQLLALHQEEIASNHDTNPNLELPLPIPLSFLDSFGSLDRLISNPLVRGYSNLSVQSDEGAHFVPYGRGHAEIASQQDIHCETSMERSISDTPIRSVKSKVIQNETVTVSTALEAIDRDDSVSQALSSDLGLSEPQPADVLPPDHNGSMPMPMSQDSHPNQESIPKIERVKQKLSLLLKEWKLAQYSNVLINEMGYDDIEDWKDITMDELNDEMHFKPGHAKRFMRKTKEYFDNKD